MQVALPYWRGRLAPVFDVAGQALIVDLRDGRMIQRRDVELTARDPAPRAAQLRELGIELLICGALSREYARALEAVGVRVISHLCGDVEQVLAEFADGRLQQEARRMPGCCGRRRRRRCHRNEGPRMKDRDRQ